MLQKIERAANGIELFFRRGLNKPIFFDIISSTEGEKVGESFETPLYPFLHDMHEHMDAGYMTTWVLLKGLKGQVNAYRIIDRVNVNGTMGYSILQPCHWSEW